MWKATLSDGRKFSEKKMTWGQLGDLCRAKGLWVTDLSLTVGYETITVPVQEAEGVCALKCFWGGLSGIKGAAEGLGYVKNGLLVIEWRNAQGKWAVETRQADSPAIVWRPGLGPEGKAVTDGTTVTVDAGAGL